MIIDIHAHVFKTPRLKLLDDTGWMSVEQQLSIMDEKHIDIAVILPLNNAESPSDPQSMDEILSICHTYPDRFIPFCNRDPRLPLRPDLVRAKDFEFYFKQYKDLGCKGLGELTARIFWDEPVMLAMLEACQEVKFPVIFHTTAPYVNQYGVLDEIGLPRLEKVLQKFPELKFLGHSQGFWSEISSGVTEEGKWKYPYVDGPIRATGRVVELMRKYPNLYGDISAGSGLNALTRDPKFSYEFIDEFQNRLLLGLDYCSIGNDMSHIEWLRQAREAKHISDAAYERIVWKNTNDILHLGFK